MDFEEYKNKIQNEIEQPQPEQEPFTHTDALAGVFSDPSGTFQTLSKIPPKAIHWLLPMLLFCIINTAATFILLQNPQIKSNAIEKQISALEEKVATEKDQAKKEQMIEGTEKFLRSPAYPFIVAGGTILGVVVFFFILAGIYTLFGAAIFKGEGNYSSAMIATGLPFYIGIVGVFVITFYSFFTSTLVQDVTLASFVELPKGLPLILGKLVDPIAIWTYSVTAIGLTKMFKLKSYVPFFILIFTIFVILKVIANL